MSEKTPESSGFRVVDKRRFDESGETREGASEEKEASFERPGAREPVRSAAAETKRPAAPSQSNVAPETSSHRAPSRDTRHSAPHAEGQPTVDFSSLIMSLATQALVMMGEIPTEEGGRPMRNLEGAQQTIDIIAMLAEKTKGNLSAEEHRVVDEVLAHLRLAFVNSVGK